MDYVALAAEIGTDRLQDSSVSKYLGKVVKHPYLIRNTYYIMRIWSLVDSRSDNPYRLVRFLGAGQIIDNLYDRVPLLQELKSEEAYFFENPIGEAWRITRVDGVLALNNDSKQRTTFSALLSQPSIDLLQPLRPAGQPPIRRDSNILPVIKNNVKPVFLPDPHPSKQERLKEAERLSKLTVQQVRDTFRRIEPVSFEETIIARFLNDQEHLALQLSEKFLESELTIDGFSHAVIAPTDKINPIEFIRASKQMGAFEILAYKRIAPKIIH